MYHIAQVSIQPIYCDMIQSPTVKCTINPWMEGQGHGSYILVYVNSKSFYNSYQHAYK